MSWTSPADLKAQVRKLWDKGSLLAACADAHTTASQAAASSAVVTDTDTPCHLVGGGANSLFPLRLRLVTPRSTELADRFEAVRQWATALRQGCQPCRLQERELRHRVVGSHSLPEAAWLDSLADAAAFIGKTTDLRRFQSVLRTTEAQQNRLLPWLKKRPLVALALVDVWPQLLAVVAWLQAHPRPGVYLRQVDVAGVDSKFLEAHRGVLTELLDLCLPAEHIHANATGISQFGRRYGFQDKPLRVRFRWFGDVEQGPHGNGACPERSDASGAAVSNHWGGVNLVTELANADLTVTQTAFERLNLPVQRVFITENEVNFLAFPPMPSSLVVFGAGYGFDALAAVRWLQGCALYHWGDIDTHGFAILDQLRAHLPHAQSLLMDEATFMAHQAHWGCEPQPVGRELPRLNLAETALYCALRSNQWGNGLRLEQEHIGFAWVQRALAALGEPRSDGGT